MAILPQPNLFQDWKQWGSLLIQALRDGASSASGIPSAITSDRKANFGGQGPWPTLSPGEYTIFTTVIKASSLVFVSAAGPALGQLYEDKTQRIPGKSFVIKSTVPEDAPDVAWVIFQSV